MKRLPTPPVTAVSAVTGAILAIAALFACSPAQAQPEVTIDNRLGSATVTASAVTYRTAWQPDTTVSRDLLATLDRSYPQRYHVPDEISALLQIERAESGTLPDFPAFAPGSPDDDLQAAVDSLNAALAELAAAIPQMIEDAVAEATQQLEAENAALASALAAAEAERDEALAQLAPLQAQVEEQAATIASVRGHVRAATRFVFDLLATMNRAASDLGDPTLNAD